MKKNGKFCAATALISITAGALLATALVVPAAADGGGSSVRWNIIGIIQGGNVVGNITGGGQPWSTLGGDARVDLAGGNLDFEVRGLVLAGGNSIGTPDAILQVKGTLVCNAGAANQAVVDTPLVTLSAQGDAEFEGNVGPIPAVCTPSNTAFLVRIGAGRWIANGAVRTSRGGD